MTRRVLVIDADHPIGRAVCRRLATAGDVVLRGWSRAEAMQVLRRPGAERAAALAEHDAIVNALSQDPVAIRDGAAALYEALARLPPRPVVHVGSIVVQALDAPGAVIDETGPANPDSSPYVRAHREAERLAAGHPGAVRLRPAAEVGADVRPWFVDIGRLLRAGRLGPLGAAGDGVCQGVAVADVAEAVCRALVCPERAGRVYLLCDPAAGTWNDYFRAYATVLGLPSARPPGQLRWAFERALALPLKLLERLVAPLGWQTPALVSPSMVRTFARTSSIDSRRAETELGLRWTPLAAALRQALDDAAAGVSPRH